MNPANLEKYFYLIQIALGAILVLGLWFFAQRDRSKSNFKLREADRGNFKSPSNAQIGTNAKSTEEKDEPILSLAGIQTHGSPHEILQIKSNANKKQVLEAYRKLMKHYHPDKVARPGTQQWQDAQDIASAINRAKDEMLKKLK